MKFLRSDGSSVELGAEHEPAVVAGGPEGSGETSLDLLGAGELRSLLNWIAATQPGVGEDEALDLRHWPGWHAALATHQSRMIVASMSTRELLERLASK